MSSISRALSIVVILAIAACSSAHAQAPNLPDLHQTADALGRQLFLDSASTGMVLVVVRGNETYFGGFGETALGSGQRPTPNSILRLCSLSKIFATDLLIKLAVDKTVRLDDKLQLFAPPHAIVPAKAARAITLADLATHTAGLPREVGHAPRGTPHFTFPDYAYRWRWLPKQHLITTPGTAAAYSNIGFDLLGDALEHAAHTPYAKLLADRTTTPLGMHETGFTPNPGQCARLLLGARDQGPCTDTQNSAGSSGLYSTATDMTIWLKYLLGTGAPAIPAQNPAAQAVSIDPADLASEKGLDHAGVPTGIGLGWMHLLAPGSPSHLIEKTGGGAGFATYIAFNPAHRIGLFIAVTDGLGEPHSNVFKLSNNLLLALAGLPPLPPDAPPARRARKLAPKPHKRTHA